MRNIWSPIVWVAFEAALIFRRGFQPYAAPVRTLAQFRVAWSGDDPRNHKVW